MLPTKRISKGKVEFLSRPVQKLYPVEHSCRSVKETSADDSVNENGKENANGEKRRSVRAAARDARWKTRLALDSL